MENHQRSDNREADDPWNQAGSWYDLSRRSESPPKGRQTQRVVAMSAVPVSRSWRKFLRFRVRGLIALVLVIGLGMGWIVRSARTQREAVAAINKAGGLALYDFDSIGPFSPSWLSGWKQRIARCLGRDYVGHVVFVQLDSHGNKADCQRALDRLTDLRQIQSMNLIGNRVTDRTLAHLENLTTLKFLMLQDTTISDAGLFHLRTLANLKTLYITNAGIGDEGLTHLRELTNLEQLTLCGFAISDAGLASLRSLTKLKSLTLSGTQVTDAGMANLRGLTILSQILLDHTQVTHAGVTDLKQALPSLSIVR
jgi:internalin A